MCFALRSVCIFLEDGVSSVCVSLSVCMSLCVCHPTISSSVGPFFSCLQSFLQRTRGQHQEGNLRLRATNPVFSDLFLSSHRRDHPRGAYPTLGTVLSTSRLPLPHRLAGMLSIPVPVSQSAVVPGPLPVLSEVVLLSLTPAVRYSALARNICLSLRNTRQQE